MIKRPFAVTGFVFLAACLSCSFGLAFLGIFYAVFAVVVIACLRFLRYWKEIAAVFAAAALASGAYYAETCLAYIPAENLDGKQAVISGRIQDLPVQSSAGWYYIIKPQSVKIGGENCKVHPKIRLKTSSQLSAQPFDTVTVKVSLYLPPEGDSGGFSSRSYYRSKGIYLFASPVGTASIQATKSRPFYFFAIRLRQYISSTLDEYVGGSWGALSKGILIGDVSTLPDAVKSDFTTTGISHILAVSGTQTSLIAEYMLLLLCTLRVPKRAAAGFSAAAVFLFMAVTGFSASVMRAGIMSIIYLAGLILRREADALNSLGFSVLLLCLANPFAATDTGLLLSFSATLGMIAVSGRLSRKLAKWSAGLPQKFRHAMKAPAGLLCQTVGASLLTYPVIMLTFQQISLVTLFSNIPEVPASLFVTLASAVIVILAPLRFFVFLIKPLALLIRIVTALMMGYARLLAELPFATVSTSYGFVGLLLLFALLEALLYAMFRHKGADIRVLAVCFVFLLAAGAASYTFAEKGVLEISSLPVSNGGCSILYKDGGAVVFDPYGSNAAYQAEEYLKARGIRKIDALILPAYNKTRVTQANDLLGIFRASEIYIPGAYRSDENPSATCVSQPLMLSWNGMILKLIPDRSQKTMVMQAAYGNSTVLFTGGIDAELSDFSVNQNSLKSSTIVFDGNLEKNFVKAVSPTVALEGASAQSAYGGALLRELGCTVKIPDGDQRLTIMTRGNGIYMTVKQ